MLMLSSQEWIEYYKRRNAAKARRVVIAQMDEEEELGIGLPRTNKNIVSLNQPSKPQIRYYYDPQSGQMQRMMVPLLAGHPMHGEMPEDFSTTQHLLEIPRPPLSATGETTKSLQSWMDLFETPDAFEKYGPQEGNEFGTSENFPDEMYGSPGEKQWWSAAVQQVSRAEVPMLIHPRVRSEINAPSLESANFRFEDKNEMSSQYNMAHNLMWLLARFTSIAGNPEKYGPVRSKRAAAFIRSAFEPNIIGRKGNGQVIAEGPDGKDLPLYQNGQMSIRSFLLSVAFPDVCSAVIKEGIKTKAGGRISLDREISADDIPPEISDAVVDRAMNKLFTTYYNSGVGNNRTGEEATGGMPPMMYLIEQMKADVKRPLLDLSARMKDRSLQTTLKSGGDEDSGMSMEDTLVDQTTEAQMEAVMEQQTDSKEQKLRDIMDERQVLLSPEAISNKFGISPQEYGQFINNLNVGFSEFIRGAGVQLPMGEIEIIAELSSPNDDGTSKADLSSRNPIPDSFCTNCGESYRVGPNGEKIPALQRYGEDWACRFCQTPSGEPFSETGQQHNNTIGLLNRLVLAYLETMRRSENNQARRGIIENMMIGIPITFERAGSHDMRPKSGHSNYIVGVSVPMGNRIVVRPLIYSGAKKNFDDEGLAAELPLHFRGWEIGELVRGMDFPTSQVGTLNSAKTEMRPYRGHPSDIASEVAKQWSGLSGEGTFLPESGLQHPPSSQPPTISPEQEISIERTPKQREKVQEKSREARQAMIREYNTALSTVSMFMLNIVQRDPSQAEKIEGYLSGWSNNIAEGMGGLDANEVADDIRSMMDFIGRASERGEISPDVISGYVNMSDDDPRKAEIDDAISKEWDKDETIDESINELYDSAEEAKRNKFSLGASIIGNASKKLFDHIGTIIGGKLKDFRGRKSTPFSFVGPTVNDALERQHGIYPQEGKPSAFRADVNRFRQDLSVAITGLFGFGGNYGGVNGEVGSWDNERKGFSINFDMVSGQQTTIPDGGYMLFVEGQNAPIQAFKNGNTWTTKTKLPPGTRVILDDYIKQQGAPGAEGGSNVQFLKGDNYSPEAIANRWGIDEQEVKGLSDQLLISGVDNMFSKIGDNKAGWNAVTKEVFIALLPTTLQMFFIQQLADQFRNRGEVESYRDTTATSAMFCRDVGNVIFGGGDNRKLKEVGDAYGVPPDLLIQTAREMQQRWGPSYRTYYIAQMYGDRLDRLGSTFTIGKRESKRNTRAMTRMASARNMVKGAGRWQKISLTG